MTCAEDGGRENGPQIRLNTISRDTDRDGVGSGQVRPPELAIFALQPKLATLANGKRYFSNLIQIGSDWKRLILNGKTEKMSSNFDWMRLF